MSDSPSMAVRLYGTEEAVTPPRVLEAGALRAELDSGNLRHVRYGDIEIMRAISFIVRDRNWGTYNPQISNLQVSGSFDSFRVEYDAVVSDALQQFRYSALITGHADGSLEFKAHGNAVTDFVTNRTGFVVLHAIAGVAGGAVEIEHVDGRIVKGSFPRLIDPVQPMMDLRALTHEAAPGLRVTCTMDGDTFEMEDQRNWTDASYKTYVRPLALPWPYTLGAGAALDQSVKLSVSGRASVSSGASGRISLVLGGAAGKAPPLGIGLDPADAAASLQHADELAQARPAHLVIHHDPRRGHHRRTLEQGVEIAGRIGAEPWLEAVIGSVDAFQAEIASLGETVRTIGSPFGTVLLSPAPDLKCTLPGSEWPAAPAASEFFSLARQAFPNARLGGGMFSYFTELNRKRPPVDLLDLVTFTTCATVHAGDDRSVMEGLESLPAVAASAAEIAGKRPWVVGPSAIGMRMNPYGEAPLQNPDNIRQAMNFNDPRQRGLLGAAWTLGYYAHFARGGAQAVTLGAATGAFGLVYARQAWVQPWYDEHGGVYPAYHVVRGLAAMAGRPMRELEISAPEKVQAVAIETDSGLVIWAANLSAEQIEIELPRFAHAAFVLDAASFVSAASNTKAIEDERIPLQGTRLTLDAYAVAEVLM